MMYQRPSIQVRMITDAELESQILLRDVKAFLRNIALPRRRVVDWLYIRLGVAEVLLIDEQNNPVTVLKLDPLEKQHFDLWYRGWIVLAERHTELRIRKESRERIRLLISLLRIIFPKESAVWGRPDLFFRELPHTHWAPMSATNA